MNAAMRYKICRNCNHAEFPIAGAGTIFCRHSNEADCPVKIYKKEKHTMMLKDTALKMQSDDHKERFEAEYYQLVIRFKKLQAMLQKWDDGELEFEPSCPRGLLNLQIRTMSDYIAVLEARAIIEGVALETIYQEE